jgi:hypothetical protein
MLVSTLACYLSGTVVLRLSFLGLKPDSARDDAEPTNLIQVILRASRWDESISGGTMPGFVATRDDTG